MKLPHEPSVSLHILPPWFAYAALGALLFALLILYMIWRARQKRPDTSDNPPEASTTSAKKGDGFTLVVNQIEAEFLASHAYRRGLHALAAAIRTQIETNRHFDAEEMTVTQIRVRLDNQTINNLLRDLRTQQFGESEPQQKDFKKMCSRAKRTLGKSTKKGSGT